VAHSDVEPDHRLSSAAPLLDRCDFPSGTIACAVSGGADSLALLALACATGAPVTAIHVDHGLRSGSDREVSLVASAAERLGAAFRAERVDLDPGPNLEARARAARYAVLPSNVCTGHTADDLAETVLLNLLRGAGVPGISAMRHGPRHPILRLRRFETRELCDQLGLTPFEDPMNDDPRFGRVRVRHEVLPLLNDVAGRDVVPLLARQSELGADVVDVLDVLARDLDPTDAKAIAAAPAAVARWALRAWLRRATGSEHPFDAASIERAMRVARGEVRAAEIGGWRLARTASRLRIEPVAARAPEAPSRRDRAPTGRDR
jgi:tRNA(Ile)-lysidine synthase